jgi:hypothetical protein
MRGSPYTDIPSRLKKLNNVNNQDFSGGWAYKEVTTIIDKAKPA